MIKTIKKIRIERQAQYNGLHIFIDPEDMEVTIQTGAEVSVE